MTLQCPSCDEELEFDFDPRGQTFDCPACNYRFTVPTVLKATAAKPSKKTSKTTISRAAKNCYWLGIFFGIMGVFIANLTEGQAGSREALRGAVLNFLIIAGGILVFLAAPGIADLISK